MNIKNALRILAATSAVATAGCLSKTAAMLASSDPVEQGRYTVLGSEVTGTDTQVMLLFMTFGASGSGARRATEDALSQAPSADALVRVAVDTEEFYFPFNFIIAPIGIVKTRVTGTPVKINQN